jgi:hypothetical protein
LNILLTESGNAFGVSEEALGIWILFIFRFSFKALLKV